MILRKMVGKEQSGSRLDDAIATLCTGVSKTEARRIIDRGGCTVNVALVRVASRSVKTGDVIEIGVMETGRFQELQLPPEALLYEDGELIAVNKPAGINSQRTPYQLKGTLEYWVSEYFKAGGLSESARVVHRLDRGTSGAIHRGNAGPHLELEVSHACRPRRSCRLRHLDAEEDHDQGP